MATTPPPAAAWCRALTLEERRGLRDRLATPAPSPEELAEADRFIERWRRDASFGDDAHWHRRLEQLRLDPKSLRPLIATPAAAFLDAFETLPPWIETLERLYPPSPAETRRAEEPDRTAASPARTLAEPFRPVLDDAARRLRRDLEGLVARSPGLFDPETLLPQLGAQLQEIVLSMAQRVLALELQIARLEERLEGETPEARFGSFLELLARPDERRALLELYPTLARQVVEWAEARRVAIVELLERLALDRERLAARFARGQSLGASSLGPLIRLEMGLGDRHRGHRTVARLTFEGGARLYYKPKSLEADRRFLELTAWIDERSDGPALAPPLRLLEGGDEETGAAWGWVEEVRGAPCASRAEVERFYWRQGAWIAVFYLLDATDMHWENLIAAGEHPVPIDLETLLQPVMPGQQELGASLGVVTDTVLRSGLLPRRFSGLGRTRDMSGLGGRGGDQVEAERLVGEGTDEMRFGTRRITVRGAGNQVRWVEASSDREAASHEQRGHGVREHDAPAWRFLEETLRGFEATYRLLLDHRGELLAEGGPLEAFAATPLRVLVRGTETYARLLGASFHSDYLQDALERDVLFDKLWLDVEVRPAMAAWAGAEHRALCRGDTPCFTFRAGDRALEGDGATGTSGLVIEGFLPRSGLDRVLERAAALSEDDLTRQRHVVRLALQATTPLEAIVRTAREPVPVALREPEERLGEEGREALRDRALAAAREIGRRLRTLALGDRESATWLHVDPDPEADPETGGWALAPVGPSLFSGASGIALFLAQLGRVTDDPASTELARRAWQATRLNRLQVLRHQGHPSLQPQTFRAPGAYSGLGGLLYAALYLGALWEDDDLLDEAAELLEPARALLPEDSHHDLIGGAAGLIVPCLALHRLRPGSEALAVAREAGDRLLAAARVQEGTGAGDRLGWPAPGGAAPVPLSGFGHGAAGGAWALGRLWHATGDPRYRDAAHAAWRYERATYDEALGTWPDLRPAPESLLVLSVEEPSPGPVDSPTSRTAAHAWCHGSAGIALGRLASPEALRDAEVDREIERAVRALLAQGFGNNHCLCHGDLGNLEILRRAARHLEDPALEATLDHLALRILEEGSGDGWRCGVGVLRAEVPGLMVGLAGIGYGLLRLAHPERVPSVLELAIPG